jgi:hypothetical protein
VRRHEPAEPRRAAHDPPPREAEPLPAEAAVLGLQRAAGNRAVSSLLARQPAPTDSGAKPKQDRAATSTLGLGEVIGVIPLDSASLGQADRDGNVHDLNVMFVNNPAVPLIQEAMLKGKPIPEGFYSSTSMKLTLTDIVITSMTFSDDPEGGQVVSLSLNFTSSSFEPVR